MTRVLTTLKEHLIYINMLLLFQHDLLHYRDYPVTYFIAADSHSLPLSSGTVSLLTGFTSPGLTVVN